MMLKLVSLALMALILVSCAEGPQGPDPGMELYLEYPGSLAGQTLTQRRSAAVYLSTIQLATGGTKTLDHFFTQSSRVSGNEVQFHLGVNPGVVPAMSLYVGSTLPRSPGTYAWKAADLSGGIPQAVVVESGPKFLYDGGLTFFPVEGETVVTNVVPEGNGVALIEGYFTGTMRSVTGQTLKVQSGVFRHPRP